MNKIEIDEAIVTEREDGILHVHFKERTEINLEVQNRLFDIYRKICGVNKRPFLYTSSDYVTVTEEARGNAIKVAHTVPSIANAMVASSIAYKLVANFYLIVNKPQRPHKIFNDEKEAIEWLKTFL